MAQKITIKVSDDIAAGAEAERLGTDVATVVERALVKDLGFRTIERIQERFDLTKRGRSWHTTNSRQPARSVIRLDHPGGDRPGL